MSSVPRKPLLAPMAVFRPAPLPECAVSAWCSPAEVFEPCETLRAARPVHGPVPTTIRGSGDVRYANSAIQQIDPALASALPVSHTALSRSSSASSPALAFPTLPATRGRFTHVHRRLTLQLTAIRRGPAGKQLQGPQKTDQGTFRDRASLLRMLRSVSNER